MSLRPPRFPFVAPAVILAVPLLLTASELQPAAPRQVSPRDAARLREKVAVIAELGRHAGHETRRTLLTEDEVNAFLAYDAREDLPAGIVDPSIVIIGAGRISARAVVDLDEVRREQPPASFFDPVNFIGGRLPVTAAGVLTTANGVGRFALEAASIGGVQVPTRIVEDIVRHYARTPGSPDGVNLDDPFELPARIREIQVEPGQAVVVQ